MMLSCSFSRLRSRKRYSKARILRIGLVAEDRQRQVARRAEHLDFAHIDFDEARRHVGVLGAGRAPARLAIDLDHEFRAQFLRLAERRRIRIDDALRDPVVVAQVDEENAAVVADSMAPARQTDFGPDLGDPESAAGMCAIAMHHSLLSSKAALAVSPRRSDQKNEAETDP